MGKEEYTYGRLRWFAGEIEKGQIDLYDQQTCWIGSQADCALVINEKEIADYHVGISYDAQQNGFWLLRRAKAGAVRLEDDRMLPVGQEVFVPEDTIFYLGNGEHTFLLEKHTAEKVKQRRMRGTSIAAGAVILCAAALLLWMNGKNGTFVKPGRTDATDISKAIEETKTPERAQDADTSMADDLFDDMVSYDEQDKTNYFNDIVVIYTDNVLPAERQMELAARIGGEIVENEQIHDVPIIQVRVPKTDLSGLKAYADQLMQEDGVLHATYDIPVHFAPDADNNTWRMRKKGTEPDRGNIDKPDGNDWWAEAIDAYYAWEHFPDITPVKAGVIDTGIATENEDLRDKVEQFITQNSANDHGTGVSGIIAAKNNDVGIRGIADQSALLVADYTEDGTNFTDRNVTYYTYSLATRIGYVHTLINQGAKVINCSFGIHYYDNEHDYYGGFGAHWINKFNDKDAYQNYVSTFAEENIESAKKALTMLYILHKTGYEDYLIVQSAGNGKNNEGPGVNAQLSCWLCGITPEIYDEWRNEWKSEKVYNEITALGYTYFKDHFIVVGSVKKERDDKGNYKMAYNSNFGENVDLCAPGEKIFTTNDQTGFSEHSGTSFAAPMVTGAATLLWSINPNLSSAEVKQMLINSAKVKAVDEDGDYGDNTYPMLNVGAAAKLADEKKSETSVEESPALLDQPTITVTEPENQEQPQAMKERRPETEAPVEQPQDQVQQEEDPFRRYLREVLVPQYGVIATNTLQTDMPSGYLQDGYTAWNASDVNGLLSATIRDFDHDGYDEMLVTLFYSAPGEGTALGLQMYEYAADTGEVTCCADRRMPTTNGYFAGTEIGWRQTGIFVYEYQGETYIAVDSHVYANESITTLAVFTYIGVNSAYTQPGAEQPEFDSGTPTQLLFRWGAGYQQQGNGDRTVYAAETAWEGRTAIEPSDPLNCSFSEMRGAGWTVLRQFHPDDPETGAYVDMTSEQAQEFMQAYAAQVNSMGLYTNDLRLGADAIDITTDEYRINHYISPQIYAAVEGELTWISGMYTYGIDVGRTELLRQDNQNSLDEFR